MSLLCRLKNLVHKGLLKKEDLDRIVIIPKEQENKVIKMREATPEERESISKYIKNISNPTVVNFWDLEQEPKYCDRNICIKNEYDGIGCDKCEVTKSQEPCDDCVSKRAALDCFTWTNDKADVWNRIKALPPVTPKLQMIQNPCAECGCNYCTNDDCENRYIVDIAKSEGITEDKR